MGAGCMTGDRKKDGDKKVESPQKNLIPTLI